MKNAEPLPRLQTPEEAADLMRVSRRTLCTGSAPSNCPRYESPQARRLLDQPPGCIPGPELVGLRRFGALYGGAALVQLHSDANGDLQADQCFNSFMDWNGDAHNFDRHCYRVGLLKTGILLFLTQPAPPSDNA